MTFYVASIFSFNVAKNENEIGNKKKKISNNEKESKLKIDFYFLNSS